VLLTNLVYEAIGIKPHTVTELSALVANDDKVWDIYANGYTVGVNQCEQDAAKNKIVRYKPHNISELSAFIAAIRPGFKSMYSSFESRKPFSYGIKPFDDLIQTEEFPFSYILYQEQLMTTLNYAGFPMDQCYQIIKDIAKKHPEKVLPLKDKFLQGFAEKIKPDCSSQQEADDMATKVWEIVYDNTAYGFNSAHAYAMALDSLYGAWQKANYPYEFYETYLNFYANEGEKEKNSELIQEMKRAFNIQEGRYKWGVDNRKYKAEKENNIIIPALIGLKGISQKCADKLYELYSKCSHIKDFHELWFVITEATNINSGQFEKLIRIGYFSQFGERQSLLEFNELALQIYKRSQLNKRTDAEIIEKYKEYVLANSIETEALYRNLNSKNMLRQIWADMSHDKKMPLNEQLQTELEVFGAIKTRLNISAEYGYVVDVNAKYTNKIIKVYRLKTGEIDTMKVKAKKYDSSPIEVGMIIKTIEAGEERKWTKDKDGKWIQADATELVLHKWSVVSCSTERKEDDK
jgi:DNA polymerase III alpha subunit